MAIYEWQAEGEHLTLSLVGQGRRGDFVLLASGDGSFRPVEQGWTNDEVRRFVSTFERVTMKRLVRTHVLTPI